MTAAATQESTEAEPLVIARQGSFYFGGTVIEDEDGHTLHGSHGYAEYQVPVDAKELPLIMWHGGGQSGKTWETTPDGREGFETIFLRRGFPVYIVDEPHVGRGGRPLDEVTIAPNINTETLIWEFFRLGTWEPSTGTEQSLHPNVKLSQNPEHIKQYLQQQSPNLNPPPGTPRRLSPGGVVFEGLPWPEGPDAGVALVEEVGPAVLITHSHGGFLGWSLALRMQTDDLQGIVSYEPVRFPFPEGEMPENLGFFTPQTEADRVALEVPLEEFMKLTRFPIQIVYGDNLDMPGADPSRNAYWQDASYGAEQFVEAVNRHGGDASILYLPDAGLVGNTHFPFSDTNNIEVANLLSEWLAEKGLAH